MKVKTMKWISRSVNIVLIALFFITLGLVFTNVTSDGAPKILGQELNVVYSGSMEPEISTGSVIGIDTNINPEALSEGDVVMFQSEPGVFVTHRVIDVVENNNQVMYRTKGDNNEAADSSLLLPENIHGVHSSINIPFLGYVMDFANSSLGIALLMIIPGILLVVSSGKTIYKALKEQRNLKEESSTEEVAL
ncbi:signal peptidase I SipW [Alkalibacillus haloalkaliphilus]|uniref:Signal peptidase I n=1 Tax=Alkalibacillus haloalkaliphilus TaxID=94136 RepID=A0A511VZT0_9BACI|nr:signal peptidase I [Alkalibacillus haloalkaliphilus]GEN44340.1 S26 family signal peptidase [Alkalibacillus haloalkaliphilus]